MKEEHWFKMLLVSLFVGAIFYIVGYREGMSDREHTAIKDGAAHYDSKTGKFKWNVQQGQSEGEK